MKSRFGVEKWKKLKFPEGFNTKVNYHISNYGRVRNRLADGSEHIKKPLLIEGQLVYKFSFPAKLNNDRPLILHQKVNQLVARHFYPKEYFKGCYVLWKDYNKLNNYYKNLIILDASEGHRWVAYARNRHKDAEQSLIFPPTELVSKKNTKNDTRYKKVELDDNYFKRIPHLPNYEINRFGVIRRAVPPFKRRIIKPRLHPTGYLFCDLKNKVKRYTVYPHKEVAKLWNININPEERRIVSHIDGDLTNNNSNNLEWTTPEESARLTQLHKKIDYQKVWATRRKRYGKSGSGKRKKKQPDISKND